MPVLAGIGSALGDVFGGASLASLLGLSAESVVPAAAGTAGLDLGAAAGTAAIEGGTTTLGFASDTLGSTLPVADAFTTGALPVGGTPADFAGLTTITPSTAGSAAAGAATAPISGGVAATAPAAAAGATPDLSSLVAGGIADVNNPADIAGPLDAAVAPTGVVPAAAPAATPPTAGPTSSIFGTIKDYAPLASAGAAIGGLGYNILKGNQEASALSSIQDQVTAAESMVAGGGLPPGMKTMVQQWVEGAKAAAAQNAATAGMSTDPRQNSALAQQNASIDAQAQVMTAQLGQTYLQEVLSGAGVGLDVSNAFVKLDQMTSQAISNMAGALGKTAGGTTINIGGGQPNVVG